MSILNSNKEITEIERTTLLTVPLFYSKFSAPIKEGFPQKVLPYVEKKIHFNLKKEVNGCIKKYGPVCLQEVWPFPHEAIR